MFPCQLSMFPILNVDFQLHTGLWQLQKAGREKKTIPSYAKIITDALTDVTFILGRAESPGQKQFYCGGLQHMKGLNL